MRGQLARVQSLFLLPVLFLGCVSLSNQRDTFTVAAVQFEVREEIYSDLLVFQEEVEQLIEKSVEEQGADLIVFPEYTSVFLSLHDYSPAVAKSDTFAEGIEIIRKSAGPVDSLKDLFIRGGRGAADRMDQLWGGLARKYRVYIVAGTAFVPVPGEKGEWALHNRAFVYGPKGRRIYTQDKVFLTDFEQQQMELTPGSLDQAGSFTIGVTEIVLTICRDTFMEEWEPLFSGAELWLDIKANGAAYNSEQAASFRRALPERIAQSDVPYGITVCLTGSYLDLFWEGESSVIKKDGRGYTMIDSVENWTETDILYFTLPN